MRILDLLPASAVRMGAEPADRREAIAMAVDLLRGREGIVDPDQLLQDVLAREGQGGTGMGEGIAIPHAKSAGVRAPALCALSCTRGVDFGAPDGQPCRLIFLIAAPAHDPSIHLGVLSRLAALLADPTLRGRLCAAADAGELRGAIAEAEREREEPVPSPQGLDLVAVTACPAGLSHTYMAAEALEREARAQGLSIKVEADGAAGPRNPLSREDIAKARAVIVAADRAVEMDRFLGKPLVLASATEGARDPGALIRRALGPQAEPYDPLKVSHGASLWQRLFRHLMSGISLTMPLVATAGILSSLELLIPGTDLMPFLVNVSWNLGAMIFPVLSAVIACSIAGRRALVAGLVGGLMAAMGHAGVLGALILGFAGGAVAQGMAWAGARARGHDAMFALLISPLAGGMIIALLAELAVNPPCAELNDLIDHGLGEAPPWLLGLLGAILGGMMAADMGGPLNKLSYSVGVLMLANTVPAAGPGLQLMAAVMAGGMIPPLALGLAALCTGRHCFTPGERQQAWAAVLKGLLFVTEGALPLMVLRPLRSRLSCVLGAAVGGGLSMLLSCGCCAPHGGILVIPLCDNPLPYALSIALGTLCAALLLVLLRWRRDASLG
ncbi:MAG: fructose-specific PTS transporter subunit EIIC [Succinivibrionaceae bacterium]|nr:fructose-specific PTS transporter subunit EIIC [Succinivibrionaceae bacterium]